MPITLYVSSARKETSFPPLFQGKSSIGRATDIGLRVFNQQRAAMIIGAPQIKRFRFAGHLFAAYQGKNYRIDRHPVMSVHPVTPMHESDLLRHLSLQSDAAVDLIDVHDAATQEAAGTTLLELPKQNLPFVVGSSDIEYALLAALRKKRDVQFQSIAQVAQMLVISGSVSPTTERQIAYAKANGFDAVAADPLSLAQGQTVVPLVQARKLLAQGKSPHVYSAAGPTSDRGSALHTIANGRETLSKSLGKIARQLIKKFKLKRLVIAGSDTSSHAL